jgi:hypothetical protein
MVRRIYENAWDTWEQTYYTNILDAIQDTIIDNFPDFKVRIVRGKHPFVSVDVTKNVNRNMVGRLRDYFVIRPETDGKITLTCETWHGYDAEIFDLQGIVNYFNDYLSDSTAVESVKRNKRVKEDFTVTDADYGWDIAEEVANIMQDMDWRDNLDGNYETYDDEWDAYVDQVLAQLESDPQEVIDWLEDEEGSDVHRSLIRNIIKCFGGSVSESVKKKNSKSLKENLDGVDGYAVDIHDMGKGYHHLLLFTDEDTAESAYNGLAECEEYADRGVDDDGYEYDEYALDDGINQISGMADEIVNEVDMRREVDRNDIWTAADDTRYQIIGSVDLWIYW